MPSLPSSEAVALQRGYYAETAGAYHDSHVCAGDEHFVALEYVAALLAVGSCHSVLDVGSGTGRALRFLSERGYQVIGVEPVEQLRAEASRRGIALVGGSAVALPLPDSSVDAVISTGVLHHVPDPAAAIGEMLRVARRAVFISDSNRFGQGTVPVRLVKFAIYKLGLWPTVDKVRTHGRGYMKSEGDGIFYSYSIYDSLPTIAAWSDRSFVIPTSGQWAGFWGPLFAAPSALLVGIREPTSGWAGVDAPQKYEGNPESRPAGDSSPR